METETESLFDRIGGEAAITAAVEGFYERVIADPLTRPFFERLDLAALVEKQISFMGWAFGAPKEYRGRDLRTAHADLVRDHGLSDQHFDAVARHLEDTLRSLRFDEALIAEAIATIESTRDEVLGR